MTQDPLDRAAADVLRRFPGWRQDDIATAVTSGGFSGARVWRIERAAGSCCLRLWPPNDAFPAQLDYIHRLMTCARAGGLDIVPRLFQTDDGGSRLEHRGRWWELSDWRPGRADFREHPHTVRLQAACVALARLHAIWQRHGRAPVEECPAIDRRLATLELWQRLRHGGWDPLSIVPQTDPLRSLIERAAAVVACWLPRVQEWLRPWVGRAWALQPCLCDVRHDHLLFEGDTLSGLVDYGAVKLDQIAGDLARMLGSLLDDDEAGWETGLAAYRSVHPFSAAEEALARILDHTGTVLGVANWLRWLYAEQRVFDNHAGVAQRLETLVARIERWRQGPSVILA